MIVFHYNSEMKRMAAATYMIKLRRLPERASSLLTLVIVAMSQPLVQAGIIMPNHLEITSEHGVVCNVESDDGWEESDVCFCDMFAEEKWTFVVRQMVFDFVECGEKFGDVLFVGFLLGCETGFVYAIVDV